MGVGQPAGTKLNLFARLAMDAFGHRPYHVGSSLLNKTGWRDVDVRLLLPDDEFDALVGPEPSLARNPRLAAHNLAWSTLGRDMTGLPIDFQLQRRTDANAEFEGPRGALALKHYDPSKEVA